MLQYDPNTNRLNFAIAYQGLSAEAIMAHFHIGKVGVMGPIVQTICGHHPPDSASLGYSAALATSGQSCPKGNASFITGSFELQKNAKVESANSLEKIKQALLKGQLYINFHTCLNEPGELRG